MPGKPIKHTGEYHLLVRHGAQLGGGEARRLVVGLGLRRPNGTIVPSSRTVNLEHLTEHGREIADLLLAHVAHIRPERWREHETGRFSPHPQGHALDELFKQEHLPKIRTTKKGA
ncbi:MAG: hypothetical protein HY394_02735 [Candidatus Diapherotrites archaeon]|nr:hypothetical protein [Candidatus Diapherotrites archaeon]